MQKGRPIVTQRNLQSNKCIQKVEDLISFAGTRSTLILLEQFGMRRENWTWNNQFIRLEFDVNWKEKIDMSVHWKRFRKIEKKIEGNLHRLEMLLPHALLIICWACFADKDVPEKCEKVVHSTNKQSLHHITSVLPSIFYFSTQWRRESLSFMKRNIFIEEMDMFLTTICITSLTEGLIEHIFLKNKAQLSPLGSPSSDWNRA